MASSAGGNLVKATIKSVWAETPTVKGLRLALDPCCIAFQPGQWVDFHIPGIKHVGGYSICSTPQDLKNSGTFDLCVKISGHPCAQWVHQQARPGDQVEVQVGGTFTLASTSARRPALFVAGGIGITCLSSMLGHLVELEESAQTQPPLLIYSAGTPDEFALLPRLLKWQQDGLLQLQLHTTKDHGAIPGTLQDSTQQQQQQQVETATAVAIERSRIGPVHLQRALQALQQAGQGVDAYVCGPPSMTDEIVARLERLGLPAESIRTEKWWG